LLVDTGLFVGEFEMVGSNDLLGAIEGLDGADEKMAVRVGCNELLNFVDGLTVGEEKGGIIGRVVGFALGIGIGNCIGLSVPTTNKSSNPHQIPSVYPINSAACCISGDNSSHPMESTSTA
jgi:hypothetical protein